MALILAGYDPYIELLGVSCVAGNQTCDKTTENAVKVLAAAGLANIEVCQGQAKPLIRQRPMLCPEIHGDSGLDGPHGGHLLAAAPAAEAPPLLYPRAVPRMYERISMHYAERREKVQLVAVGALTNVALLIILYPEVCSMIDITIMGGCMGTGNTGPVQEFNIQTDPEAAKVVFEAGVPLVMVPLEVTHTALATPDVLARLCPAEGASAFQRFIRDLLLYFASTYKEVFEFDSPPLHDPTAVAYIIDPSLFQTEMMRVDIETNSTLAAGQTVCDIWHQSGRPKNVTVAKAMDVPQFWDLQCAAVEAANMRSPMNYGEVGPALDAL